MVRQVFYSKLINGLDPILMLSSDPGPLIVRVIRPSAMETGALVVAVVFNELAQAGVREPVWGTPIRLQEVVSKLDSVIMRYTLATDIPSLSLMTDGFTPFARRSATSADRIRAVGFLPL